MPGMMPSESAAFDVEDSGGGDELDVEGRQGCGCDERAR